MKHEAKNNVVFILRLKNNILYSFYLTRVDVVAVNYEVNVEKERTQHITKLGWIVERYKSNDINVDVGGVFCVR